jgi:hypothetical protein
MCRRLDAVTLSDPRVDSALAPFERLRLDSHDAPADKERLKAQGYPLIVVFAPTGEEVARHRGYLAPEEMIAFLGEARTKPAAAPR